MKNILFVSVLIFSFFSLNAQSRYEGDIEITPNTGFSSSFLRGGGSSSFGSRNATQYGVLVDYYFNDQWSIRSGLSVFSMGGTEETDFFGFEFEYDLAYNYLNIPINANWHFGSYKNWNLNFGITPGLLTKARYQGENIRSSSRETHLAISYGLGYKFEVANNFSFLIDGQGLFGLTNATKDSNNSRYNIGHSINIGGVYSLY